MLVRCVMAASLDGKISSSSTEGEAERRDYGFINQDDHELVRQELLEADAVILGAHSVRSTGSLWAFPNHRGVIPQWVIFTQEGLSPKLPMWKQQHVPIALVSPEPLSFDKSSHVQNWVYKKNKPGNFTLKHLKEQGCNRVLVFGGGHVNRIFFEEGLIHELKITISPIVIATKNASSLVAPSISKPVNFQLLSSQVKGNFVFLYYKVQA